MIDSITFTLWRLKKHSPDTVPHVEPSIHHGSGVGEIQPTSEGAEVPRRTAHSNLWCQKSLQRDGTEQLKCHSSSPTVQQLRSRHGRSSREGAQRTGFSGEQLNCFETVPHRHEGGYPRHETEPREQSCTSHAGAPVESCTVMRGDFQGRHDTGKANATQQ